MTDEWQKALEDDGAYVIARDAWSAFCDRFRRVEHVDPAELHARLNALNLAYARGTGVLPRDLPNR